MHNFTFDPTKAAANLGKHGVSFADAEGVLEDPLGVTKRDPDSVEDRFVAVGLGRSGALLVVVFTDRNGVFRLISARHATRKERKSYEG